jgi:hypothetical protein
LVICADCPLSRSNPKDYADNEDARQYDKRLRPPVRAVELEIDPTTGMKNYIANERGDWATSAAYIKFSLSRSIHYGRTYTNGGHKKGNEEDLCEALRCLGQGLHTLEDFAAHTNYVELALREMGFKNVFTHTGTATEINLQGRRVFPLVTGTFGMVDFFHSMMGEADDHFTQSEVNEMDIALGNAEQNAQSNNSLNVLTGLLGKIPGTKDLVSEAEVLKRSSAAQGMANQSRSAETGYAQSSFNSHERTRAGPTQSSGSGMPDLNPQETVAKIYPILAFRDKVMRKLNSVIEKIPGLESLVEKISETLTVFIMSLLSPFIRPLIKAASKSMQTGSAGVIDASGKHQYEPWTDPHCTDPTHSLLSKDHFANILNEPAGRVASSIVEYVVPRVLYAWQHIDIPEHEVLNDCMQVFHHPALRNMRNDAHRAMFEAVEKWAHGRSDRGASLNSILSSEGVRSGRNTGGVSHTHTGGHGGFAALGGASHGQSQNHNQTHSHGHSNNGGHSSGGFSSFLPQQNQHQNQSNSSSSGMPWDKLSNIPGLSNLGKLESKISNFLPGGLTRDVNDQGTQQNQHSSYQSHQPGDSHETSYPPPQQHGGYHQPQHVPQQSHGYQHNQHHEQHYGGSQNPPYYGQQNDHFGHPQSHPPHNAAPHGSHPGPLGGYGYGQGNGHGHGHGRPGF